MIDVLLFVLSFFGIFSIVSLLSWWISAIRLLEDTAPKRRLGPLEVLRFIMALIGGFSLLSIYAKDPEAGNIILGLGFFISVVWYIWSGRMFRH